MSLIAQSSALSPTTPGFIYAYAGTDEPDGYFFCNGQALDRAAYAPLFGVIGTTYGVGDGISTFNVPDLRGRSLIGKGQGSTAEAGQAATNFALGSKGGAETHTLTTVQMPAHSHSYN